MADGRWQDDGAGGAGDDEEEEEDAEETALEGYETVLDKVDSPVQEYQMFRGTLFSTLYCVLLCVVCSACLGL